jgi:hypothetical protein
MTLKGRSKNNEGRNSFGTAVAEVPGFLIGCFPDSYFRQR